MNFQDSRLSFKRDFRTCASELKVRLKINHLKSPLGIKITKIFYFQPQQLQSSKLKFEILQTKTAHWLQQQAMTIFSVFYCQKEFDFGTDFGTDVF